MDCLDTVNTTRLAYHSPVDLSVATARMLWPDPATQTPQVVVLAPLSHFGYPLAAAPLVHDPVNGVLLLTPDDGLPELLSEELCRLNPQGTDALPPVVVVGPVRQRLLTSIETLGYGVLTVTGRSVAATAANAARLRTELSPSVTTAPTSVMLVGLDHPAEGLAAAYYATHSGVPVLFSQQDRLPSSTARFLRDTPGKAVYVIGSRRSVSDSVFKQVGTLSGVPANRVAGSNALTTAIALSLFHDQTTDFGWGRDRPRGDAFTFVNASDWELALAGANLAHRGKHTPLLLVRSDSVPPAVAEYLLDLKPPRIHPPLPPFMHGFLLGCPDDLTVANQASLEMLLSIDDSQPLPDKD